METIKSAITNSTLVVSSELKPGDQGIVAVIVNSDSSSIGGSESSDNFKKSDHFGLLRKYKGFLWSMLSSLLWTMTALIVTYLKDYHPINLALWRYQGALVPSIPLLIMHTLSDAKNKSKLTSNIEDGPNKQETNCDSKKNQKYSKLKMCAVLLVRSFLTCNALVLHFYSLKYLPLGDALVITSSTPIFAYILAHYFLREACGIFPMICSLSTLMGVVIITKPQNLFDMDHFDFQTFVGVGLALGCTLLSTISFITLRWLRKIHYSYTLFSFGTWGTFECLGLSLILGVFSFPHGQTSWLLASGLAVLTFFGQIAIIMALKCEQTGPVSLVRTCDVIFGYSFQIIASGSLPDSYSLVGASIVIICLVFTAIRKWLATLSNEDSIKKKFWYLLR